MKVERIEPNVVTYKLTPSEDDAEYTSCMWARYIFDCDNGRLNINSDAGDYSYGWGHNDHEDFMHLMSRINGSYLLNKIARRSVFDAESSKQSTIENIEECGVDYLGISDETELKDIIEQIKDIDNSVSEETFYYKVDELVPAIDFESIEIVKEYPRGALVVVDLFERYIQPKIKEEFGY